jgi:L-amino acid N-acyltransferase YncA
MVIRRADPERDAAACAAIYAPSVLDGAISFEEAPPSAGEMAERMSRLSGTHPWLVAERDREVVGFAYASEHAARAAYRSTVDVAVYVHPAHHRRGVGRHLYEALLPRLREQGFRVACAGITLPNEASVRLHEALGFRPVGVYRAIGWKAGAWRDVGWWQRDLAPGKGSPPAEPSPPAP